MQPMSFVRCHRRQIVLFKLRRSPRGRSRGSSRVQWAYGMTIRIHSKVLWQMQILMIARVRLRELGSRREDVGVKGALDVCEVLSAGHYVGAMKFRD